MNSTTSRDRLSLWLVLAAGLLLLAAAAISRADDYSASAARTDHFSAGGLTRLSLENVNGDIRVSPGPQFSATADVSVRADTPALAKKYLDETRVELRNEGDGSFTLATEEPGARVTRRGRRWEIDVDRRGARYRVETRFTVTIPAAASLDVHTVNGNVTADGIAGVIDARSVNGRVKLSGTRRDVSAHSVNGAIEAAAADLPRGASFEAETVNGSIRLQFPARTAFDFQGHTMNGDIVSTFPLPPVEAPADAERMEAERRRMREEEKRIRKEMHARQKERDKARRKGDDESDVDVDVDLTGLDEGLAELSRELSRLGPQIASAISQSLNHTYRGAVGGGGADVRCSTLNGRISILSEGVPPSEARSLIPRRGTHGMHAEVPEPPEAPAAPTPMAAPTAPSPRPPRPPRPAGVAGGVPGGVAGGIRGGVPGGVRVPEEGSIVRGDIDGDFSTTLPFGDVQVGKVSGAVRIVTYGGQIRVVEAGKSADLSTSGGDIRIDGVHGDLRAVTHGGELRIGRVTGAAKLETMGGDVDLGSCGGSVIAKTGGGDLRLHQVRGSVRASAGGGDVHCEIVGRETPEGVSIASGAGDVTLVLPSNYRADVDVQVNGVDDSTDAIVSDFPEISISHRRASMRQTASGALNGGGPKVTIRISSGTVRLKKGPPA